MGWTTKDKKKWTTGSIHALFRHIWTYRGMLQVFRDGQTRPPTLMPGIHPPIIEQELALAAEKQRRQRSYKDGGRRAKKRVFPLVRHVWCGECGSRIVGNIKSRLAEKNPNNLPVIRYICRKDTGCSQSYFDALKIEGEVWAVFNELRHVLVTVATQLGDFLEDAREQPTVAQPAESAEIRDEIERLDYLFQRGRKSVDVYERERRALEGRLAIAEATIDAIGTPQDPLGMRAAQHMLANFDEALKRGSDEALAEVVDALVDRVILKDGVVQSIVLIPALEQLRAYAMVQTAGL